jgi:hypothetical protein
MKGPIKRSNQQETDDHIEAHQLAIGKIVMAWNEYQETLGQIFAQLFGIRNWVVAHAAWQALENDRAQRNMLLAAARFGCT